VEYRPLGPTGVRVSALGLGALTFGRGMSGIAKVDQPTADRIVGRALEAGINLFDTSDAWSAGESEEILGRALAGRRDEVVLATRVGARRSSGVNDRGLTALSIVRGCEASLRRLRTESIDLLQLAEPDPHTPFEETARALDDLVRRGLVRYVGFANFPAWEVGLALGVQRAIGVRACVALQTYYSLVGRDAESDLLPLAARTDLAVLVSSPLAGGYLSGKYADGGAAIDDRRSMVPYPEVDEAAGAAAVVALRQVAGDRDATPAQVALAWLLRKPVTSLLVGVSQLRQLSENNGALELHLTAEQVRTLDALAVPRSRVEADDWRHVLDDPLLGPPRT